MTLVRTLLLSYTPFGAVAWLTIPNRGLNSRRPIDKWSSGFKREVQEVADLIDGGLPAAPSAQPDEGACSDCVRGLRASQHEEVESGLCLSCLNGPVPTPPPSLSQQWRRAEQDEEEPTRWYVHCGCDSHGDHLGCGDGCRRLGCAHPYGVEVSAPTEEDADRRTNLQHTPAQPVRDAGEVELPPAYEPGDDCQSCGILAIECGHVRPESPLDDDRDARDRRR